VVVKQCSISGMKSEGTSCEAFIMFNVSFIGICVKRNSTSKYTSRSVGHIRIFWIFCMKFIELVMCDSDFSIKGCSVCARKRDKLYVRECMALIIGLRGMFGLCTFNSPYSFVDFNIDLVLLGILLFFHQDLVLHDYISWIFVKLFF